MEASESYQLRPRSRQGFKEQPSRTGGAKSLLQRVKARINRYRVDVT
jgi:hypothetical protein